MKIKDAVEVILAFTIIGTFCWLVMNEKIESAAFIPVAMYTVKKFLDGVQNGGDK